MYAKLEAWMARIDALSLRERAMLLAAVLAVLMLLGNALLLKPVRVESERVQEALADWQTKLEVLELQARQLADGAGEDPAAQRQARLAELQGQLAALDRDVQSRLGVMLEPHRAAGVLEAVLARQGGLHLVSMEAARTPVGTLPGMQEPLPGTGLERHDLVLQVEGGFLNQLAYLRALEALPSKLFWERVEMEVPRHPTVLLTLQVYTLGRGTGGTQ